MNKAAVWGGGVFNVAWAQHPGNTVVLIEKGRNRKYTRSFCLTRRFSFRFNEDAV